VLEAEAKKSNYFYDQCISLNYNFSALERKKKIQEYATESKQHEESAI